MQTFLEGEGHAVTVGIFATPPDTETGAVLAIGTEAEIDLAPARRVFFPFDNNSWGGLSADGFALVSNSIDWALGMDTASDFTLEITAVSYECEIIT